MRKLPNCLSPGKLTQVLHILIRNELGHNLRHTSRDTPGEVTLVHDNSIGHGRRDERQAIRDPSRGGVVVEEDEGQGIAADREEQCQVARLQVSDLEVQKERSSVVPVSLTYPTNQANL